MGKDMKGEGMKEDERSASNNQTPPSWKDLDYLLLDGKPELTIVLADNIHRWSHPHSSGMSKYCASGCACTNCRSLICWLSMSRHPADFSWAPSSYLPQHHRHSGKATWGYILEAQKHQQPGQVSQASSSSGISIFKISHSSCSRIKLRLNKVDINKSMKAKNFTPPHPHAWARSSSSRIAWGTTWDRSRGTKHLLKLWKDSLSGWSAMRHPSCHTWSQYWLHCQVVVPCRSCVWCRQCLSSESIFNLVKRPELEIHQTYGETADV